MRDRTTWTVADRVIAALDVPGLDEALALVDAMEGRLRYYKVGSKLFTREGPEVLRALAGRGAQVFLDLKYHDIPSVVGDAVALAAGYENVFMVTVHASGGAEMVRAAVEGAAQRARVVAVTALTSLSEAQMHALGVDGSLADWAQRLGRLAVEAGADGLVCSAREAASFRAWLGSEPALVTPGIRFAESRADDQTRVMAPAAALEAGSDWLVVGRPIYHADDPAAAVDAIAAELRGVRD